MGKIKVIGKSKDRNEERGNLDFGMLITIIILLCIGLVMLASASSYSALSSYNNSNYFVSRQLIFALVGVVVMLFLSLIDYKVYAKFSYAFYIFALVLLIAVLTPLGVTRNGATRWLGFGILQFQPSELMKIALVIVTSTYIARNYKKMNTFKGYVWPLLFLAIVFIIMSLQNHLSGTLVMIVASASIIFASGLKIKLKVIIPILLILILIVGVFFMAEPFRWKRILSYANPEEDIRGGNWQAAQSLYAIGSGGIFGRGLGQSRQKYLWLPEAQNDFIFSVLGEEFGLVGTLCVLGLFVFFIYRGYRIAINAKDMLGSLMATGITSVFALQILVNIAVVTCTIPVTGMPLPFFSYGGTALLINLAAMGVLLSISRSCKK